MVICITSLLTGCGDSRSTAPATPGTPTIITTFSVLADMTQQIAGDTATVTSLVPLNGDAHVFEPTPADGVALINATAVIELGIGFEPWFTDLYSSVGSKATLITASTGVTALTADGEFDPHIWHDVGNAIVMAQNIRDGLISAMPNHADSFNVNASAYIAQLQVLDSDIQAQIAVIPIAQRKLVTSHDTFGYFAARYGFVVVGTGLGSVTTESSDPDAASIVALVNDIKSSEVAAIFVENMSNSKVMEQIAQEAGVAIAPPLYTDALGANNSSGATYIGMMRYNTKTIIEALTRAK